MEFAEEGAGRFRSLSGFAGTLNRLILAAITVTGCLWAFEIHHLVGLAIFKEQFLAAMLALGLVGGFLSLRPTRKSRSNTVPWYDWLLAAASVGVCAYVAVNYDHIIQTLSSTAPERWILGAVAFVVVCEATRRAVGLSLIVIAVLFILYARYAEYFPGVLNAPSVSWQRISVYLFLDTNGLFGLPLDVAATTIVAFVLFGGILTAVRGDRFITDLALIAMGRFRGGSAKVAIAASTLFGTMSGSSVSNVAVVGPITIPLMRKGGYPAETAAAVEATASTGGQIMPPVMGITAFLIADYLNVPYGDVVIAALVPALLYYLAVFVQIDLEAARLGLAGIPKEELPRLRNVMRQGYVFLLPIAILIYTVVVEDWQPGLAGMAAAVSALVVGLLRAETRPSPRTLAQTLVSTGQVLVDMLIMTAAAGVIIGALQVSGISFNFSNIVLGLAGNDIFVILLVTGVVSLILGIPLPTGVIYVMLAVLVAPALTQLGVVPMAAHLFLFYTGMLSALTPPVALSSFAAAAIAGADMWKTSWHAMRFGIIAYIIPFVFPFSLGLLLMGSFTDIFLSIATAVIGIVFIGWGLAGYLVRPLGWPVRIVLMIAGLIVLPSPTSGQLALYGNVVGLAFGIAIGAYEMIIGRRRAAA